MARVITIAGVDRTGDIRLQDTTVELLLTYQEDSCSFTVFSGSKPNPGDEIIITQDGVKLFAGIIDQPQDEPVAEGTVFYKCQARDYTFRVDQKLVVESYTAQTADYIFSDIVSKYCSGFTTTHVNTGAPVIERITFDYQSPSDCFRQLCEYVGWSWYVDNDKDLHFFNPETENLPAPIVIDGTTAIRKLRHDIDIVGLANRVYVRGGSMYSDPQTVEWKADGVARQWVLPWGPHEISYGGASGKIGVNEVPYSIGIENIDDASTKDYLLNFQEKYIKASDGTTTPVAGVTMSFSAKQDVDVITVVEDIESQQAVAAAQGGDGIYEYSIKDDSLVSLEAAEAAGNQYLRDHGNPNVKGSFETEIAGWQPGQILSITLPGRGINGQFLIQKITLQPCDESLWTYRIEYGGRLLGIADFLKALVSAQQKKKANDTALLHKIVSGQEIVGVEDETILLAVEPPFHFEPTDPVIDFSRIGPRYKKDFTLVSDGMASLETGVFGSGLHMEEAATNIFSETESQGLTGPTTKSLAAGSYTVAVNQGGGSITISGGATGTATLGSPVTFALASTTDVTFTPAGTVSKCQLEAKKYATTWQIGDTPRYSERAKFTLDRTVPNDWFCSGFWIPDQASTIDRSNFLTLLSIEINTSNRYTLYYTPSTDKMTFYKNINSSGLSKTSSALTFNAGTVVAWACAMLTQVYNDIHEGFHLWVKVGTGAIEHVYNANTVPLTDVSAVGIGSRISTSGYECDGVIDAVKLVDLAAAVEQGVTINEAWAEAHLNTPEEPIITPGTLKLAQFDEILDETRAMFEFAVFG